MTMPFELQRELPGAIASAPDSPMLARVGVVTEIVESDNITVKISGSDVLVQASYLWPQYEPLLGDRVYVAKQDAQWFVLGTMAGPLNSILNNPSFELGNVGATPTDWTVSVISSAAGVPTFRKELAQAISGRYVATARLASGAAGFSTIDVFSTAVNSGSATRWGVGYFLPFAILDINASLRSQGGFSDIETFIQFQDGTGTLISEVSAIYTPLYASFIKPVYVRTFTIAGGDTAVVAPAGTAKVRTRTRIRMNVQANSVTEIGFDAFMLRGI